MTLYFEVIRDFVISADAVVPPPRPSPARGEGEESMASPQLSPPPCGEGSGVGVRDDGFASGLPPPDRPSAGHPPRKGEGEDDAVPLD